MGMKSLGYQWWNGFIVKEMGLAGMKDRRVVE